LDVLPEHHEMDDITRFAFGIYPMQPLRQSAIEIERQR
jgi:hypothetical protein